MEQVLNQTRGQMSSLQSLIELLESETLADVSKSLGQDAADIRKVFYRAKSIRLDQGVDDDQSCFDLAHQSFAQLRQSSAYQRAQTATAEELLAEKIELLEEKYALEDKYEALILDANLEGEKVAQLGDEVLLKDRLLLSKGKGTTRSMGNKESTQTNE